MRRSSLLLSALGAALLVPSFARAQEVSLRPAGKTWNTSSDIGDADRNVGFFWTENYAITSVGMMLDPLTQESFTLRATLYSLDVPGGSRTLISSAEHTFADLGMQYYDVPFGGTLAGGFFYDLAFEATDGFGVGKYNWSFTNISYGPPLFDGPYWNGDEYTALIFDGGQGGSGGPGWENGFMPDLRIQGEWLPDEEDFASPEPASVVLVSTGLLAIGVVRRRRTI